MAIRAWTAGFMLAGILALALSNTAWAADGIDGYWRTPGKKSQSAIVHIYREGAVFNGRIAALREPRYPSDADNGHAGEPKLDLHNPDASLRERPLIGLEIVHGFKAAGADEWDSATIYDPQSGKTYKCKASLADSGHALKVRGYVGVPLFGRTEEWERVPGPEIFGNDQESAK